MSRPTFKHSVTSQGLRVLTESHPASQGVAVHLWIEVGTRDESPRNLGISHLIEHMVFKGTERMTALDIARSLEAVGGDLNAYTSREFTCYHTLSLGKDLDLSLEVLSQLTVHPLFRDEDLVKEKQVILQEMDMAKDLLEEAVYDDFFTWVYPKNSAGWPILGTVESLMGTTVEDLKGFFRDWYCAENMVLTVVGPVDHDRVHDKAEVFFEGLPSSGKRHKRTSPTFSDFKIFCPRPSEQTHFVMGWPSSSYKDTFRFESYIVNTLLGGGMTSRLYQRVREDLGLVYSIGSGLHSFKDCGLTLVSGAGSPDSIPQVIEEIHKEVERLYREGVSRSDLELYRNQVKGQILLGADDLENRASSLGINEMVYGNYRSVDHVLELIDGVTEQTIGSYLEEVKSQDNWSLLLLGGRPEESLKISRPYVDLKVVENSANSDLF